MLEDTVMYNGIPIKKAHFRAFIYTYDKQERLANNWDDYQAAIASGEWFSRREDVPQRPPKKRKQGD